MPYTTNNFYSRKTHPKINPPISAKIPFHHADKIFIPNAVSAMFTILEWKHKN